jgi:transcriptional regulator with XRE-family HTH domain
MNLNQKLSQQLSQIVKDKGITQRWLTEQLQKQIPDEQILNVTEDKVSRWLLGNSKVDVIGLFWLSKYLGIDLNELRDKILGG